MSPEAPAVDRRPCPPAAAIELRPAGEHDLRAFWHWRNDESARAASFDGTPVPFDGHEGWFRARLSDPTSLLYVVLDPQARAIGYVRFAVDGDEAEISIALDGTARGRGYGRAAIDRGCELALALPGIRRIVAHVKPANGASLRAFLGAGFAERDRDPAGVEPALRLVREP